MLRRQAPSLARLFQRAAAPAFTAEVVKCFTIQQPRCCQANIRLAHSSRAPLDPNSVTAAAVSSFAPRLFVPMPCVTQHSAGKRHLHPVPGDCRRPRTHERVRCSGINVHMLPLCCPHGLVQRGGHCGPVCHVQYRGPGGVSLGYYRGQACSLQAMPLLATTNLFHH
jgi:hypothetical protein